jgi:hypothetical protein
MGRLEDFLIPPEQMAGRGIVKTISLRSDIAAVRRLENDNLDTAVCPAETRELAAGVAEL